MQVFDCALCCGKIYGSLVALIGNRGRWRRTEDSTTTTSRDRNLVRDSVLFFFFLRNCTRSRLFGESARLPWKVEIPIFREDVKIDWRWIDREEQSLLLNERIRCVEIRWLVFLPFFFYSEFYHRWSSFAISALLLLIAREDLQKIHLVRFEES